MDKNSDSVWMTLSAMDMSHAVEEKNGFSYLSWAHAWIAVKDRYPKALFKKHCNGDGLPYFMDDNGYAYVAVTVQIEDETATEVFPILDYRNKPVKKPDSFSVNTSLQRCLTKCLGYLGLGCYIYAGEDLPVGEAAAAAEVAFGLDGEVSMLPIAGDGSATEALIKAANKAKSMEDLTNLWNDNAETIGKINEMFSEQGAKVLKAFSTKKSEIKKEE